MDAYPVGISYKTLEKFKGDTNLSDAMDEFQSECCKIIQPTSKIKPDIQLCKDNCDGFPKYVEDYRFFFWVSIIFKE